MKRRLLQSGFTLIELAIVLVIIGVLAGSFISTLSSRIDNTRRADTRDQLQTIKQALLGYAYTSPGNLPCPDCRSLLACPGGLANDGIEDRVAGGANQGTCSVGNSVGNLPWVTLGLGREDAWGNRYRYWADNSFARDGTGAAPNDRKFDFSDVATGTVLNRINDGSATQVIASQVAAVVFSQGKNGYGAISSSNVVRPAIPADNVDEADNADNNLTFVDRAPTTADAGTDGGEFDDIVIWLPEYELKARMLDAGILP